MTDSVVAAVREGQRSALDPAGGIQTVAQTARKAASRRTLWIAAAVVVIMVGYAVLVPMLAPASFSEVDLAASREGPSAAHWFGTDQAGRDLLVRCADGMRVSLTIAAICALASTVVGLIVGTVAAAAGGMVDAVLMRVTDAINALPHLLLGIVIVSLFRGSATAVIISIAATHWPGMARLVRSVALTTREMEYVDAAYLAGASRWHVLRQHIVPGALGQAFIGLILLLPHAIWHESALSFLGLGLQPDQASLGTLLAQSRAEILLGGWWTLVFPALALCVVTIAMSGLVGAAKQRWAPDNDLLEV